MRRTIIHSLIAAAFVAASSVLLVYATQSHRAYRRAHSTVERDLFVATNPSTVLRSLDSPEPYFRRSQRAAMGIFAFAAVALYAAAKTRRLAWFVALVLCVALAAIAVNQTGYRI